MDGLKRRKRDKKEREKGEKRMKKKERKEGNKWASEWIKMEGGFKRRELRVTGSLPLPEIV